MKNPYAIAGLGNNGAKGTALGSGGKRSSVASVHSTSKLSVAHDQAKQDDSVIKPLVEQKRRSEIIPNTGSSIRSNNDLAKISIGRHSIDSPDIAIEDPYAMNSKINDGGAGKDNQRSNDEEGGLDQAGENGGA